MEWADARVWAAAPLAEPADARLRHLFVHTHAVQRAFHAVWTGGDFVKVFADEQALATLGDVRAWGRSHYAAMHAFVEDASEPRLEEVLELPWAAELTTYLGATPASTTVGETCFQVASHSTYHRGQINARLRELGIEPPLVDYIAWLWLGRPAPAWPS